MTSPPREVPCIEAWADWAAWQRVRRGEDERFNASYRQRLAALDRAASDGLPARCSACGTSVVFRLPRGDPRLDAAPGEAPADAEAHREGLHCPACRLPGRSRAAFAVLDASRAGGGGVCGSSARLGDALIAEHGSAAWRQLRARFPDTIGTEFHPQRRPLLRRAWSRLRRGPTRHADLRALPFDDARFDRVLALEVFEHIEAVDRALAECARVLRRGGELVATAPFDENARDDVALAVTDTAGRLVWRGPEEWHRDPLGGRAACFHRFGWRLLDRLRAAGFRDARWCRVQASGAALFGLWVVRAVR